MDVNKDYNGCALNDKGYFENNLLVPFVKKGIYVHNFYLLLWSVFQEGRLQKTSKTPNDFIIKFVYGRLHTQIEI